VVVTQDRFKSAAADLAALQKRTAATQVRAAARAAAAAEPGGDGPAAEQDAAEGYPAPAAAANAAAAAANADHGAAPVDLVESDEDEEQSPWAGRPIGTKAAKRARADGIDDNRTIGRVASAVETLREATTQRTIIMAFSLPFMRETPTGADCWALQAKRKLAAAGIKVPPSKAAADASVAAEGAANGTNTSNVSVPPALGEAADDSGTGGVAA